MPFNYKVMYIGKLQEGVLKTEAIKNVSQLLRVSAEKAEKLISQNKSTLIKKEIDYDLAKRYEQKLIKAGLQIKIDKSPIQNSPSENIGESNIPEASVNESTKILTNDNKVTTQIATSHKNAEIRFFKAWIINFILALVAALVAGTIIGVILGVVLAVIGTDQGTIVSISGVVGVPVGLFASFYIYKWSIKKYIMPQF
ncbi:MAG: hypothetical protein OCC45_07715 [Desulfotalea sp.]